MFVVNKFQKIFHLKVLFYFQGIITAGDKDKDGAIDVEDFMQYLHEHELKLRLMFKRFDRNEDGN